MSHDTQFNEPLSDGDYRRLLASGGKLDAADIRRQSYWLTDAQVNILKAVAEADEVTK